MNLKWKIFGGLVVVSGVVIILGIMESTNEIFGPIVFGAVMIPAVLLSKIGLPTMESGEWWDFPTILGFVLDVVIYLVLFYLIGALVEKLRRRG